MSTFKIEIALYDLSMGMAANLSGQFLGPDHAIPMIPHTAVLAYGREYFFSSGIQNMDPNEFRGSRGIQPVQIIAKGETTVSRQEFERWCQSSSTRSLYNEFSYDLFTRNCNNFSDYALKKGLNFTTGVPAWIIDLPRKVSSSPMGQMIMPMMNGMQAPFAQNGATSSSTPAPVPSVKKPSPTTASSHNPWAHIPSDNATKKKSENDKSLNNNDVKPPAKKLKQQSKKSLFLDSQASLLLSADTNTIPICIKKLKQLTGTQEPCPLEALQKDLIDSSTTISSINVKKALWSFIQYPDQGSPVGVVMALMLLRLVVLHPIDSSMETKYEDDVKIVPKFILTIASQLATFNPKTKETTDVKKSNIFVTNISARCMAWCTLSNAFTHSKNIFKHTLDIQNLINPATRNNFSANKNTNETSIFLDEVIDCAILDLSSSRKELRQAASAFVHNLVHIVAKDEASNIVNLVLPDWAVTILCACLDGIQDETDNVTQFRRLLTVAKLIQTFGGSASSLVCDLGFGDSLKSMKNESDVPKEEVSILVKEVVDTLLM